MSAAKQDSEVHASEEQQEQQSSASDPARERERNLARLVTILRTYTPEELRVAREAVAACPESSAQAVIRVVNALHVPLRTVRDLVDAVLEADRLGVTVDFGPPPIAPVTAPDMRIEDISHGNAFEHPIIQLFPCADRSPVLPSPTDADMERLSDGILRRSLGSVSVPINPSRFDRSFGPLSPTEKKIAASMSRRLVTRMDETGQPYGIELPPHNTPPMMGLDEVILPREEVRKILDIGTHDFLGTGTHRTTALRGFLRFLTQEDLSTVLTECVVQMDDEHLSQSARMLAPEDLQSLNFAAADEIAARMLDAREQGAPDFPLRPLEPHENRELVDWSENGNPLLENVRLALDVLESAASGISEEGLATVLERRTGWNSAYAGEVALEAWKRYYREPESDKGNNE